LVYHAGGFQRLETLRDSLAVGDVALESAVGTETPAASCIRHTSSINLTFLKK
jgi:hypothetical protein